MWENNQFRVKLGENNVFDFEKIMLTSEECNIFLPMGFMTEVGEEYGKYECSGFAPISDYRIERTEDALYILENVLLILKRAIEFFIDPSKVTVTENTVFYNKDTGQVKIAYVPTEEKNPDLRKSLVTFIGQIKSEIRDGKEIYLVEAAKNIYYNNYYLREMINRIGLFKRQLYAEKDKYEE